MKVFKKMVTMFLVFVILLVDFSPFVVNAVDISQGASKGDLRLQTYSEANKNKVEIVKTDDNGVSVKKTVTKKSVGTYNIEFSVKGPKTQVTTMITLPVYVVFVIDRSYSMGSDSRWTNAEKAAIEISKQFSALGVNMAAVGYSGGRTRSEDNGGDEIKVNDTKYIRQNFSTAAITDFGNYDTNYNTGGGTNMQAGLLVAQSLLQDKKGIKHIILLSDGVPTFYYDGEGYTKGPGNSNTDEKIAQIPGVVEITKQAATQVKNAGITIHTIGYHLDKLTYQYGNLSENALAKETLSSVASSSSTYHLVDSKDKTTNVSIELGNIKTDIMNLSVANNPSVTDGIGANFKLNGSKTYGGVKTLTKNNYQVQDGTWQTLGSFDVQIDPTSPTNWYPTNNDFTLTYTHITKGTQTITCTKNSEVYWTQPAPYTIYHVELNNTSNVLKTETGMAELKSNVLVTEKNFTGYTYNSKSKNNIVIDTENNIAYVYYTRNNYDYTIKHVEFGNESNVLEIENETASLGANIPVNQKTFAGFTYVSQDKQSIVIDTENNIAYVYYTRNNYDYTIKHVEFGNESNVLEIENETASLGANIPVNQKTFAGFTYVSQDKQSIVIDTENNIAYVYYTRNKYNYVVEYYKETPSGKFELVEEDTVKYENIEYGKDATYEIKEYAGYHYDDTKTENGSSLVPGNNDLVIRLYYTLNQGKVIIHYVVKIDDGYISFAEYGCDKFGNKINDFKNVDLEDSILIGKLGQKFQTKYRKVEGYSLVGLYQGNILEEQNFENLNVEETISTFEENIKEYTYVYQGPIGDTDLEGEILPPKTDVENIIYNNYLLLISGLFISVYLYKKLRVSN